MSNTPNTPPREIYLADAGDNWPFISAGMFSTKRFHGNDARYILAPDVADKSDLRQLAAEAMALASKATARPWRRCSANKGKCQCGFIHGEHGAVAIVTGAGDISGDMDEGYTQEQKHMNGDFIAFAANHIEALAQAVLELTAECERLKHFARSESYRQIEDHHVTLGINKLCREFLPAWDTEGWETCPWHGHPVEQTIASAMHSAHCEIERLKNSNADLRIKYSTAYVEGEASAEGKIAGLTNRRTTAEDHLQQLHRGVCELCECLGAKREETPCDMWTLAELVAGANKKIAALTAENARLRDALDEIANTTTSMPAAWNDEASWYQNRMNTVMGIARAAHATLCGGKERKDA